MAGLVGLALLQALAVARVPVAGPDDLRRLASLGFEVASVERDPRGLEQAIVVVSEQTRLQLTRAGFTFQIATTPSPAGPLRSYFDFDDPTTGLRRQLVDFAAGRPHVAVDSIGASVEGRPILAVKVGAPDDAPSRPNVLFMATHHAREWVSTTMALHLIRYLADSLSPAVRNARDVWVIPVVNPDGYQYTFTTERLWRKNRRPNADGSVGVDLNRNYPGFWGLDEIGSSSDPRTEIYRGPTPTSEPEIEAIVRFHGAHPPVLSVSYHTYTGLIIHPWGFASGRLAPDRGIFRALAGTPLDPAVIDRLPGSNRAGYHPGPSWQLYPVNGEYADWAYLTFGTLAFTPELTSGCCVDGSWYGFAFPDDSSLLARVHEDNIGFAVAVVEAAVDPPSAPGPSGLMPPPSQFASLWPEIQLVERRAGSTAPRSASVRHRTGGLLAVELRADSLDSGAWFRVLRAQVGEQVPRAVRAEGLGVQAELLHYAGAEAGDAGWTGWEAVSARAVGRSAWHGFNDTLTSPELDVAGRSSLWVQLWTRHAGSAFLPARQGLIQFADGGRDWRTAAVVAGSGPEWYPLRVDLPPLETGRLKLRFISEEMEWWLDGFGVATDVTALFESAPRVTDDQLALSDNPVRGDRVSFSWPASSAAVVFGVYTFAGDLVFQARLPSSAAGVDWDLVTQSGARVGDGAYVVVVRGGGMVLRRRLFVARGAR